MKPFRARKRFFFLILAACLTLLWRFSIRPHLITPSIEQDQSTLPLITLIVVFKGVNLPPTLPYFFDSLRYQNRVELVFVQRDGCSDLKKLGAPSNLKHVCLSEKAFWLTHVDYFCRHWGGCTHHRRKTMLEDMRYLGSMPMPQAVYPILRGWVFQKYISPSTVWWGFCDVDIFLGDFARTFPYDLSEEYEILIPTDQLGPGPQLIFMRGHMTFLKNSKEVEGKMMEYGYFKSYEKWNDMGKPDSCNEESEYSHFVLSHPTLNVLSFEAMARHQPVKLFSPSGVYTLPPSYRPSHGIPPTLPRELLVSMFTPSTTSPFIDLDGSSSSFQSEDSFSSLESDISDSTSLSDTSQDIGREFPRSTKKGINGLHQFTSLGVERKVDLIQSTKPPNRGIWFTEKNVNWYTSSSDKGRWRRYFIKRGLEYSERLEPIQIIYKHGGRGMEGMEEWLYVHWQEDKRKSYFRTLPLPSSFHLTNSHHHTDQPPLNQQHPLEGNFPDQTSNQVSHRNTHTRHHIPYIFLNYPNLGNAIFSLSGHLIHWLETQQETCDHLGCVPHGQIPLGQREGEKRRAEEEERMKNVYLNMKAQRKKQWVYRDD